MTRLLLFKKMCASHRVRHSQSELYEQVQALLIFGHYRKRKRERKCCISSLHVAWASWRPKFNQAKAKTLWEISAVSQQTVQIHAELKINSNWPQMCFAEHIVIGGSYVCLMEIGFFIIHRAVWGNIVISARGKRFPVLLHKQIEKS